MFLVASCIAIVVAKLASTRTLVEQRVHLLKEFGGGSCLFAAGLMPADAVPRISWIRRAFGDVAIPSLMYDPRLDLDGQELLRARQLFPEAKIRVWAGLVVNQLPAGVMLATSEAVGDPSQEIQTRIGNDPP
jgi:hypothetical protein